MIRAALAQPWGVRHETPALQGDGHALDVRRGVFRSARHLGVSAKAEMYTDDHGDWHVWFKIWPKADGQRAIANRVTGGGPPLAYNLRRGRGRR
jgi:hypothetical protein